ncbi:endonuclease III [archaeon]|nr:endonuclease III [archaeon]
MKHIQQLNQLKKLSSSMPLAAEDWNENWKTLISIMLSARTRDEVTIPTSKKLFDKYSTIEKLSNAKLKDIEKIIKPINFYKTKSKNVFNCSKILEKKGVPKQFEKLIELPGVGRKTANVFLSELGKDEIGIDTHVSYISQKLNWTKNKDPEKIEQDLKKLFPRKYWRKINSTLVRFGKTHTSRKKKDELLKTLRNN